MSYFTTFSSVSIAGFKFPFSQTRLAQYLNHIKTGQLILRVNQFVGNKGKGKISKRWVPENKACQIFRKNNISYLLIDPRTLAYQGVTTVRFSKKFAALCFLATTV